MPQRKIKLLREAKNYSQEYLAQKLNMSQSAYSKKESGFLKFEEFELKLIAEIFNVNETFFLNDKSELVFVPDTMLDNLNLNIAELHLKLKSEVEANQLHQKVIKQLLSYLDSLKINKNGGGGSILMNRACYHRINVI